MQKQQPIWSQEHGALLKTLRENARLDVTSLAHRNTVSKSQVVQLEDGGDSSFYNPDAKRISLSWVSFSGNPYWQQIARNVRCARSAADVDVALSASATIILVVRSTHVTTYALPARGVAWEVPHGPRVSTSKGSP